MTLIKGHSQCVHIKPAEIRPSLPIVRKFLHLIVLQMYWLTRTLEGIPPLSRVHTIWMSRHINISVRSQRISTQFRRVWNAWNMKAYLFTEGLLNCLAMISFHFSLGVSGISKQIYNSIFFSLDDRLDFLGPSWPTVGEDKQPSLNCKLFGFLLDKLEARMAHRIRKPYYNFTYRRFVQGSPLVEKCT